MKKLWRKIFGYKPKPKWSQFEYQSEIYWRIKKQRRHENRYNRHR